MDEEAEPRSGHPIHGTSRRRGRQIPLLRRIRGTGATASELQPRFGPGRRLAARIDSVDVSPHSLRVTSQMIESSRLERLLAMVSRCAWLERERVCVLPAKRCVRSVRTRAQRSLREPRIEVAPWSLPSRRVSDPVVDACRRGPYDAPDPYTSGRSTHAQGHEARE
jgi:hypothetical protein